MATSVIVKDTKHKLQKISLTDSFTSQVRYKSPTVLINHNLPFRVKFTAIKVPGYSPTNVPPIPLQVIGYSNYIL
jgi:hypothetical protein